jgi:exoribonuclease R
MTFLLIPFWSNLRNSNNADIINGYLKAMQIKINPSKSYETSTKIILWNLSKFHDDIPFPRMNRDHIVTYLNSMKKSKNKILICSMDRKNFLGHMTRFGIREMYSRYKSKFFPKLLTSPGVSAENKNKIKELLKKLGIHTSRVDNRLFTTCVMSTKLGRLLILVKMK